MEETGYLRQVQITDSSNESSAPSNKINFKTIMIFLGISIVIILIILFYKKKSKYKRRI